MTFFHPVNYHCYYMRAATTTTKITTNYFLLLFLYHAHRLDVELVLANSELGCDFRLCCLCYSLLFPK